MSGITFKLMVSGLMVAALVACGGGGGGTSAPTPTPTPTPTNLTITGTVAKGAVLANAAVVAKCADALTYTTVSSATGTYSLAVPASAVPCLIQATGQDGTTWRSIGMGAGNASITPLTEMVVAKLLKALPTNAFAAYPSPAVVALLTPANLATAQTDVRTALNGVSDLSVIPDFIATPFKAATATTAGDAIDQAIDALTAALKAKGSSVQTVAIALEQGKAVSSTYPTIAAATVPTSGYIPIDGMLTPGFARIGDVWAVPGTVVVDGQPGLAVSEDNGNTWSGIPQVGENGRTAIGPGMILYGGQSGALSRHVRTGPGVWTTEVLTGLKLNLSIQSMAYRDGSYYALMSDSDSATQGSVYKSSDNGNTWNKQDYRFDIFCDMRNVVKTSDGAIRLCGKVSADGGTTWVEKRPGDRTQYLIVGGADVYVGQFAMAVVVGSDIIAIGASGNSTLGTNAIRIIRSSDKGSTWTASEAGFSGAGLYKDYSNSMVAVGNEVFLTLQALNNETFLYQSHDGGKSWFVALKSEVWETRNLWSQGGQCYRNAGTTTKSSSDGLHWTAAEQAVPVDELGTQVRTVSVGNGSYNSIVTAGTATVEKFDAKTGSWRTVYNSPDTGWVTRPTGTGGVLYVGISAPRKLLKSTDQGESWQAVPNATVPAYTMNIYAVANRTLLAFNIAPPCVGACAVYPGFQQGVFISKDEGVTWTQVPAFGVPSSWAIGNGVVVASQANGGTGLVRMEAPYTNATVVAPGFGAGTASNKTVMFDANTFWASDTNGTLRMSADGNTWQTVQLDVPYPIWGVAVCGHRLVLELYMGRIGLLVSPATLP